VSRNESVVVFGIRPAREAGHEVELAEQTADNVIAITTLADMIEFREGLREGGFDFGDGVLGIAFTLLLKLAFVLQELFTIEVGTRDRNIHR
jgi:hypothetical protein